MSGTNRDHEATGRILVTGAAGMLGQAVCRQLDGRFTVVATTHAELDVTDRSACSTWVAKTRPAWVVHLAALTDVDLCQRQPMLARTVNVDGTRWLAEACRQHEAGLLLLSSIAVFDGQKAVPYLECDRPGPINVYGETKQAAEAHVATLPRHLIVRSGWLFGGWPQDRKFVGKICQLARESPALTVVDDKVGSPTYVEDLAAGLERLLLEERQGLVHLANAGPPVSRYALAHAVVAQLGRALPIHAVSSAAFPALAPRPDMEAAASHVTDRWLRPWPEALREYLAGVVG